MLQGGHKWKASRIDSGWGVAWSPERAMRSVKFKRDLGDASIICSAPSATIAHIIIAVAPASTTDPDPCTPSFNTHTTHNGDSSTTRSHLKYSSRAL